MAKPFARGAIFFDAMLTTAQQIHDERPGSSEAKDMDEFLAGVDEEEAFQFGNLADAGDENLVLTRFLEDELSDKSRMAHEVQRFRARIHYLFVDRGCLKTGYTAHMVNVLKQQRIIFLKGSQRTLGGAGALTPDIIDRCLQRMVHWVGLADHVIHAEFTNFDVLMAFEIFRLEGAASWTMTKNS